MDITKKPLHSIGVGVRPFNVSRDLSPCVLFIFPTINSPWARVPAFPKETSHADVCSNPVSLGWEDRFKKEKKKKRKTSSVQNRETVLLCG